jgi:hypothetical protein
VTIGVDRLRRLVRADEMPDLQTHDSEACTALRREAIGEFVDHLKEVPGFDPARWVERCLVPWLQVHRYAGRKRFDYPRHAEKGERTIFNYHSALRGAHADGRKRARPQGDRPRQGLPELDELEG